MKQRTAILIAAVLTAFLLVTAGGVLARVTQAASEPAPVADAATSTSVAQATAIDPQVEALIQAREAQYQEQLAAANVRLQEAYAQQQALANQLAQAQGQGAPQTGAASASAPSATYAISPAQAVLVALSAAPGNTAQTAPQLVSFQGIAAYEVALSGGLVYVDANSGAILYNAAAAPAVAAPQFIGSDDGHEGHEEREHEEGDDD